MRIKARNGERQESEKGDRANTKQTVQRKERNTQFVLQNSHVGVLFEVADSMHVLIGYSAGFSVSLM